jgi:two-component system phosphate regulon response regulator PhoB
MKTNHNHERKRIMIVDDEDSVAKMLCVMFENTGYQCVASHSGEDAIKCATAFAPDLLICDLNLPGMNGRACAERISQILPACQVLFLTGDYLALAKAQDADRAQGVEQEFLTKPQPPLVLLREAKRLLSPIRKKPAADLASAEESVSATHCNS